MIIGTSGICSPLAGLPRPTGRSGLCGFLLRCLRRAGWRQAILVWLLVIGIALAAGAQVQACHGPAEPVCQVLCLDDDGCLPVEPASPKPVPDPPQAPPPVAPASAGPPQHAVEPEHAPPRRG